jgi:hypothetical protein
VVVVLADGETDTLAYCVAGFLLEIRKQSNILFDRLKASFHIPNLVMNIFRTIHREGDMHVANPAQILSEPIEDGPVGVDRKKDSFAVYVFQEVNDSFEEKRLTTPYQDKPDLMVSDFVNQAFPILQSHSFPGINSAIEDVSLLAPLAAHSASKIARVCEGERNKLWEIHAYTLLRISEEYSLKMKDFTVGVFYFMESK